MKLSQDSTFYPPLRIAFAVWMLLGCCVAAHAQTYDSLLTVARRAMNNKDYCGALPVYKAAFGDKSNVSAYSYYSAAGAAANCHQREQAYEWLNKALEGGLGLKPGEISYVEKDSALMVLHVDTTWKTFISQMKGKYAAMVEAEAIKKKNWLHKITTDSIAKQSKGVFARAAVGHALYFSPADTFNAPFLVYVPRDYNPDKPSPLIVYLHGGVVSLGKFEFDNPAVATEPVFSLADTYNAIVLYPFGHRQFGWVKQPAAFENVLTMIAQVKERYHINSKRIVLGGMSNGGTAAYWFASRKPNIFHGFFSVSGNPELDSVMGGISFKHLSQGKPFYSIHAADDDVFKLEKVMAVYREHSAEAPDWKFVTVDKGGHAFIFDPADGPKMLKPVIEQLIR